MYPNCTLLVHNDNKTHGGLNNTGTQKRTLEDTGTGLVIVGEDEFAFNED